MTDSDRITENAVLKLCVLEKCKTVIWQQARHSVYGKVCVHSGLHMVCMVQIQALLQCTMNTVILGIRQSNVNTMLLRNCPIFKGGLCNISGHCHLHKHTYSSVTQGQPVHDSQHGSARHPGITDSIMLCVTPGAVAAMVGLISVWVSLS